MTLMESVAEIGRQTGSILNEGGVVKENEEKLEGVAQLPKAKLYDLIASVEGESEIEKTRREQMNSWKERENIRIQAEFDAKMKRIVAQKEAKIEAQKKASLPPADAMSKPTLTPGQAKEEVRQSKRVRNDSPETFLSDGKRREVHDLLIDRRKEEPIV